MYGYLYIKDDFSLEVTGRKIQVKIFERTGGKKNEEWKQ